MDRRGGTSFAILFILNPIVILFYQNCSVLPAESKLGPERQVASIYQIESCRFVSKTSCEE